LFSFFPPLYSSLSSLSSCSAQYDDAVTQARIIRYAKAKGSLTALDVVKLDKVSILIAKEQLDSAEQNGVICRDETVEGLRYYENLIGSCRWALK
jgi:ESCRT-II complex subunit VPS36